MLEYLRHVMRGLYYALFRVIIWGQMEGKRNGGKMCYNGAAVNKIKVAMIVSNLSLIKEEERKSRQLFAIGNLWPPMIPPPSAPSFFSSYRPVFTRVRCVELI